MKAPNIPEQSLEKLPEANQDSAEASALFEAYEDAVNAEDVEAQEEATLKVWQHVSEMKDEEPSPWLVAVTQAHRCEAAFDWDGAEAAYRHSLKVAGETTGDPASVEMNSYGKLSQLYRLVGRDALAWEATQAATEAARRSSMTTVFLPLSLQAEARYYLKTKDFGRAEAAIEEAFASIAEGPMQNLPRAYNFILRSDLWAQQGEVSRAEADLAEAWPLLEPHAETYFAAGWQHGLASGWTVKAHLHAQRGDATLAVVAWQEVVMRRRIIAQLPQLEGPYKHNDLALALRELGRAQLQAGDPLALDSFEESSALRRAIGLPALELPACDE